MYRRLPTFRRPLPLNRPCGKLVFYKAEEAESFEALQLRHQKVREEIKALEQTLKAGKFPLEKQPIDMQIHRLQEQETWLASVTESQKEERGAREE